MAKAPYVRAAPIQAYLYRKQFVKGKRKVTTDNAAHSYGRRVLSAELDEKRPEVATDGRTIGTMVHRLLGDVFATGRRSISPLELRLHVANHPLVTGTDAPYRQVAKQRLLAAAAIYLRFFAPDDDWGFAGAEMTLGRRRADFVWHRDDQVMIDELKTGTVAGRLERDSLQRQVADLLKAGVAKYGTHFVGVRAIVLASPRSSYIARPDGSVEALEREGCGE